MHSIVVSVEDCDAGRWAGGDWEGRIKMSSSLQCIVIPNADKANKEGTFYDCSGLMTVTLGDGLEEIGIEAFYRCISLQSIVIPNADKTIKDGAYRIAQS